MLVTEGFELIDDVTRLDGRISVSGASDGKAGLRVAVGSVRPPS
jgi:hypothetical protein